MSFLDKIKGLFGGKKEQVATKKSDLPWACFEVVGFEEDGRIKVGFDWNPAFITKINSLGFKAETEEDTVQLFFYAASMRPTSFGGEDSPPELLEHPNLASDTHLLRT
jgi:hypothetical protein